jgi:hypothetical protein
MPPVRTKDAPARPSYWQDRPLASAHVQLETASVRVPAAVRNRRLSRKQLIAYLQGLQRAAIDGSTRSDYDLHLRRYVEFLRIYDFTELTPMIEKLELYVAFLSRESLRSIRTCLGLPST